MKKGLAIWNRKESKVGKLKKSEEEKQERRFREVGFLVFSFLFKGVPRENILKEGEGGFLFVKLSESWKRRERKQLSRLLCFIFSGEKKEG